MIRTTLTHLMLFAMLPLAAQNHASDSIYKERELNEVTVTSKYGTRRMGGAVNGVRIGQQELFRAACCNLGESFTTNPSVDVSYTDAATGARQIKLLGLSGTYVQMLVENMPAFRGAAAPFSLGYVPGTWMAGINVSKGASSVKNGYESITGQIDIDYLKPEGEHKLNANIYGDTQSRIEANFDTNFNLGKGWSTNILAHYENRWGHHDSNNDGFMDMPKIQQGNFSNRWKFANSKYIFHGGWQILKEDRNSGQTHNAQNELQDGMTMSGYMLNGYKIGIRTDRYEAYMKHAFILNPEKQMNIAFIANGSIHIQDANYGAEAFKHYDVNEKDLNMQLLYETQFDEHQSLSAGLSLLADKYDETLSGDAITSATGKSGDWYVCGDGTAFNPLTDLKTETTTGAYAQYTLNLHQKIVAMAGIRYDHSSRYGSFVTPRAHIKFQPWDVVSLRLSAGKGYRSVHPYAENHNLLASGRTIVIGSTLSQEEAWNLGASLALNIPIAEKTLKVNAEYYFTRFINQMVIDYDSDPGKIIISDLAADGHSHSHVFQVDATYQLFKGFDLTAAYRLNHVRCTYGGVMRDKPLTSKYKALVTASYKTPLDLWQFDVTFVMNGGGRMPTPYELNISTSTSYTAADGTILSWAPTYKAYGQLSAQVTRKFRYFDIYLGGENLTSYKQKNPIISADKPWSASFDPTMIYAPIDGAMAYIGIRVKL